MGYGRHVLTRPRCRHSGARRTIEKEAMTDPKQNARTIRVQEYRFAPSADGPWGEASEWEVLSEKGPRLRILHGWSAPELRKYLPESRRWSQERVVPYVPESEIDRYRAVVEAIVNLGFPCPFCSFGIALGPPVRSIPHADCCPLVANGFITKEGEALK